MSLPDDRAAVRYLFNGTPRGELRGIPAAGKHVVVSDSIFSGLLRAKLIEQRGLWDSYSLMQQLGVVPFS